MATGPYLAPPEHSCQLVQVGGCKAGSAAVTGDGAYGRLKFEAGIHRVQRVPVTEKSGRVHTSAAAVSVLPQADEVLIWKLLALIDQQAYACGSCSSQRIMRFDAVRSSGVLS